MVTLVLEDHGQGQGQETAMQWFWRGKRSWEPFDEEASLALEKHYREHRLHKRNLKQANKGRRSLDTVEGDHRYPIDGDHTVSFAEMKQYRAYGDPSWFRRIRRGMAPDTPRIRAPKDSLVSATDSKPMHLPRPPANPGRSGRGRSRTLADRRAAEGWGSASTAADAWVQEGAKREAARRARSEAKNTTGGEFALRVLPCQDTEYKDVSSGMVRWFQLADEDPGASKAAAASRKAKTPENIRHLQRSLRQARVYKNVQSASTVNLQAAAAQEATGFDMVDCFSLPSEGAVAYGQGPGETTPVAVGLTGSREVVGREWGRIPAPPQSQSARTVQAASEVDLDHERSEPWSAREFGTGTNWSQTKKPRATPNTHGRQHVAAVTRSQRTHVRPELSWARQSAANGWAAAVLGPSAADAGTPRAGTGVGAFPPIVPPVGVTGEIVMSQRPRIVYKFSPRYSTFDAC